MKPMKISADKASQYYYESDPLFRGDGQIGSNARWVGRGAEAQGLRDAVDLERFNNLLYGKSPDGEVRLVGKESGLQAHHLNAATDIPLTAPKSFSVAALYDPALRDAIRQAAMQTSAFIESNLIHGRQTINGQTELVPGKMIASMFFHSVSRANDAHMHAHLVIQNMVIRPDGSFSTLENKTLFQHQREITQTFYSFLAVETRKAGYGIELHQGKAGQIIPELAGYDQSVNQLFSKRSDAIQGAEKLRTDLQERMPYLNSAQVNSLVQLQTKDEKSKNLTEVGLTKSHTDQLKAIGTDVKAYLSGLRHLGQQQHSAEPSLSAPDYISLAVTETQGTESTFSREKIISDAVKVSIGQFTRPQLEQAYEEALKAGEIIAYSEKAHTTPEMEKLETKIVETAVRDSRAFTPLMRSDQAGAAISAYEQNKSTTERAFEATAGQKSAINLVLTSGARLYTIAGDAGSGKSAAFDCIRFALADRSDVKVIGLGFQGKAAAMLEVSSSIKSQTVDSFLLQKPQVTEPGERQLWVVDEASMLGSRHLALLLERSKASNAQVVLVGDTKQIAAISAGKMMSELQRLGLVNTTIMDEVRRQQTGYTKEIAHALKQHDLDTAFTILSREGQITEIESREGRMNTAAEKYVSVLAAGATPLAMVVTNNDRKDLIAAIRERQKETGQIGKEDVKVIAREPVNVQGVGRRLAVNYAAGNFIICNHEIGDLKKGTEARILSSDPARNSITVAQRNGQTAEIFLRQYGGQLAQYREQETSLATGETGIFLKNDNSAQGKFTGMKNGVTFTIETIQKDGNATIKMENGNETTLNLNGAYVTNGQAVTVDKAQGATAHTGIVMASSDGPASLLNENKNYVAMTRMTHNIELIIDNTEKFLMAVKGEQIKTSTSEYTMTAERLKELKSEIAELARDRNDYPEQGLRGNSHDQHETAAKGPDTQHQEMTLAL